MLGRSQGAVAQHRTAAVVVDAAAEASLAVTDSDIIYGQCGMVVIDTAAASREVAVAAVDG